MKQVIVMRTDLNMRKGKMVAQGAHASLGSVVENFNDPRIKTWLKQSFTKICVGCSSLKELNEIANNAEQYGIINCVITDSGLTEFNGVPTTTCVAIGPDEDRYIDAITGHLKLL